MLAHEDAASITEEDKVKALDSRNAELQKQNPTTTTASFQLPWAGTGEMRGTLPC